MGLSEDTEQPDQEVYTRYQTLCGDLNIERPIIEEAWRSYESISQNYSLEGDKLHWLACALYVACRKTTVPTVGKASVLVEGNCVSLTRLLRSCKLSLIEFFDKFKKWADMANLSQEFRAKFNKLERNFEVSAVIFKKLEPMFKKVFKDPATDLPKTIRSRKLRRYPCTSSEVFDLCWTMFVCVKGKFPAISDDLVNCFHLLLVCCDYFFANVVMANRTDLLHPEFIGLPPNFHREDYSPPIEPPCIVDLLCETHEGIKVEAKSIKEHWWKPYIASLLNKGELKGDAKTLMNLLDNSNFDVNKKRINEKYEEYILSNGDFDERIFLGKDATSDIGTPTKAVSCTSVGMGDLTQRMQAKRNLQSQFDGGHQHLAPATPLTGRNFLSAREAGSVTPVSTATQRVSRLQTLLSGRQSGPSELLLQIFRECRRNPESSIRQRVKDMGDNFCKKFADSENDGPGSSLDFARKRLQLGESLYYKVLEKILLDERKRYKLGTDFTALLEKDMVHELLFACCLEIVLYSYNSERIFPWVLTVFGLEPFHFYKVIEVLIRAEDQLARDVVKHLNQMEEQILESLAWGHDSPLWRALEAPETPVPSCEDVSLPSQLDASVTTPIVVAPPTTALALPLGSYTIARRLTLQPSIAANLMHSPLSSLIRGPAVPITPSTTPARRRLFGRIPAATDAEASEDIKTETKIDKPDEEQVEKEQVKAEEAEEEEKPEAKTDDVADESAVAPPATPSTVAVDKTRPKRTGSLGLFFRKFYHLASVRLQDLCNRLQIEDEDLRKKVWTCFEYSIIQHTELMRERHLDQILMCSVYVICKVTGNERTFTDIMRCYRLQPHAISQSHVYRSVLLGSSLNPTKEQDEGHHARENSESSHCPPTPSRLACTGSKVGTEERGDLIKFYNTVFVLKLQKFAVLFSVQNKTEAMPLSPLPLQRSAVVSPRRQVSSKHSVFLSPLKATQVPRTQQPMRYSFNRSPSKDLHAINALLVNSRVLGAGATKRHFENTAVADEDAHTPSKLPMLETSVAARKISFQ